MWQKLLDGLKATADFIAKNKEVIGTTCLVITKVLPSGTVVYDVLLVIGTLLTTGSIVSLAKNGELNKLTLNGKKTTIGNIALVSSDITGLIILSIAGLVVVVIGVAHKFLKHEISMPKRKQ